MERPGSGRIIVCCSSSEAHLWLVNTIYIHPWMETLVALSS